MLTLYTTFHNTITTTEFLDHEKAKDAYSKCKEALAKFRLFKNDGTEIVEYLGEDGHPISLRLDHIDSIILSPPNTDDMIREKLRIEKRRRELYEEAGVPYPDFDRYAR